MGKLKQGLLKPGEVYWCSKPEYVGEFLPLPMAMLKVKKLTWWTRLWLKLTRLLSL